MTRSSITEEITTTDVWGMLAADMHELVVTGPTSPECHGFLEHATRVSVGASEEDGIALSNMQSFTIDDLAALPLNQWGEPGERWGIYESAIPEGPDTAETLISRLCYAVYIDFEDTPAVLVEEPRDAYMMARYYENEGFIPTIARIVEPVDEDEDFAGDIDIELALHREAQARVAWR